jgi:hypothetical protein
MSDGKDMAALVGVPYFEDEDEGRDYVARVWERQKEVLRAEADRCAEHGGYLHINDVPKCGKLVVLTRSSHIGGGEVLARWAFNDVGLGGWLAENDHWLNPYFMIGWREA